MNEENINIVPGTPETPVTPDAVSTPVLTETPEEAAPVEMPAAVVDTPVENTTSIVETPEEVASTIEETTTVAPIESAPVALNVVNTPEEVQTPVAEATPVVETPVESAPAVETSAETVQTVETPGAETTTEEKPKKKSSKVAIIIIIVGLLALAGYFGYNTFFAKGKDDVNDSGKTTTTTSVTTLFDNSNQFDVTIGGVTKKLTYGYTVETNTLALAGEDMTINENTQTITRDILNVKVLLDDVNLGTYMIWDTYESEDLAEYEVLDDTNFKVIKDSESDAEYIVLLIPEVKEADEIEKKMYITPTAYDVTGKKIFALNTSSSTVGGVFYATDATSKLVETNKINFAGKEVNTIYTIENNEIHFLKNIRNDAAPYLSDEYKVVVKNGVASEELVTENITANGAGIRFDTGLITE